MLHLRKIKKKKKKKKTKRVVPTSSAFDDRAYRVIRLSNGLRCLLVSDANSTTAAASVSVAVGSVHNPRELEGLAHYLEHLLFLGTAKYPDENTYNKTLAEHGGRSNAFTAHEHTNYYFDVQPDKLKDMLDIFAQFFVAPLFTASASDRELNAVNAEHAKNLQSDSWRLWHLRRSRGDGVHPQSRFHTGDLVTLRDRPLAAGIDVRAELLAFHRRYYSASRMTGCVVGRESLDELERSVAELFAGVATHDTPVPLSPGLTGVSVVDAARALPPSDWRAFPLTATGEWLDVDAVRDQRKLTLSWLMPSEAHRYENGNMHYIANLIGHEGPGSILSALKAVGLANTLSAGPSIDSHAYQFFDVSIDLTDAGLANAERVVAIVFQYVRMLVATGASERLYNELRDLGDMSFRFASKQDPIQFAQTMSMSLQHVRDVDVLVASDLQRKFDAAALDSLLAWLTPESVRVSVLARRTDAEIADWQTEPVYGTKFRAAPLSAQQLASWKSNVGDAIKLHLPPPNPFVPHDFAVVPLAAWDVARRSAAQPPAPLLLHHSARLTLWHLHDAQFQRPKCNVLARIEAPFFNVSPRNSMLLTLLVDAVQDNLNEFTYDAELAALHFSLHRSTQGISLTCSGFHDKLPLLCEKVLQELTQRTFTTTRFAELKDKVRQSFANVPFRDVYHLASYFRDAFMVSTFFSWEEQLTALAAIELADLQQFQSMVLTGARITALVHGNMTAANAAKLVRGMAQQCFGGSVVPALPYYVAIRPQQRIVALPAGQSTIRQMRGCDEENVNSAIVCVYQTPGNSDARSAAVEDLLGAIVGDAFFTQLRTQEQLGYIVFFSVQRDDAESCFRCIVQSDAASPVLLNWRIERYLQRQCLAMLRDMPAAEFAKYREALVVEREQPEKRLSELSQRIWREVDSGSLNFRRKEVSVELIRSIEQAELVQYFATHVANVDTRRKFAVEVFSQAHYDASLRAHTGERPLLRVTARAGSKDLDDARADGLPIDGDSIDTAALESKRIVAVGADWNAFKLRSVLGPLDIGDLSDARHQAPPEAKAETAETFKDI
jgi:insulysin